MRLAALCLAASAALPISAQPVSFARDIRPILERSCLKCHGAAIRLSKLDLRTREAALQGGEKGPAIVPGDASASRLFKLISGLEKPLMPMDGKLSAAELSAFKQWIDSGAPYDAPVTSAATPPVPSGTDQLPPKAREWWAFKKPAAAPVPPLSKHPIDAFLEQTRRARNLPRAPRADRATLVRRAYLDLTGIPPTPAESARFIADESPGAWPRLIDDLLALPAYGERWGRHWLDVARYADSNGFEHDFNRPNAWRYRDYVIRAFNEDKPYTEFLLEQLAGDELDQPTPESLTATGFLRNYSKVGFREKDNPQFRYEYLDDMIATVGKGVLGLTVQCARCHDHKFDPILQRDYYRMQSALFGYVEVDHPLAPAAEARAWRAANASIDAQLKPLRQQLADLDAPYRDAIARTKIQRFPDYIQRAVAKPEADRTPGEILLANQVLRTAGVGKGEIEKAMTPADLSTRTRLAESIAALDKQRPPAPPLAMGITDGDWRLAPDGPGDEPAPGKGVKIAVDSSWGGAYIHDGPGPYRAPDADFLIRGDIEAKGAKVAPGFVTVATYGTPPTAHPPADNRTSGRRRALADWLGSPDNPLTARVIVNRLWHHHFGRGLVSTPDNFGKNGDLPSHPALLDWLAVDFMQNGWTLKRLHRQIMTSDAYQMSSSFADPAALERDPDNIALWRFRMQRLEAEAVRDSILAVSGTLNRTMFGQPVFPTLTAEVLGQMKNGIWERQPDSPDTWRRSVYVYRKRGLPFPFFEVFDLPDQTISCSRRNVSTVPTQALTLLNNEFVLNQSKLFAQRIAETAGADPAKQIDTAWRIALARAPRDDERAAASQHLSTHGLDGLAHVLFNLSEFLYLR